MYPWSDFIPMPITSNYLFFLMRLIDLTWKTLLEKHDLYFGSTKNIKWIARFEKNKGNKGPSAVERSFYTYLHPCCQFSKQNGVIGDILKIFLDRSRQHKYKINGFIELQ